MSNWIVNTIRHKFKQHGTNHYRIEIKPTQKVITTDGVNPLGKRVTTRLCSDTSDSTAETDRQLGHYPVLFHHRVTIVDQSLPPN